jgi:hypothetical protein
MRLMFFAPIFPKMGVKNIKRGKRKKSKLWMKKEEIQNIKGKLK